jgi:hypothetical protein
VSSGENILFRSKKFVCGQSGLIACQNSVLLSVSGLSGRTDLEMLGQTYSRLVDRSLGQQR